MARWRAALPMVRPFYAVKCNPSLPILRTLALCGAGFDCASKQEIELILHHHLVNDPERDIIFANPCKQMGDLKAIIAHGYHVRFVTVDSVHEMIKLHRFFPQAKVLIRIATQDDHAVCAFSSKFGAPRHEIDAILQAAIKYKLEVYGVSFHVGSGNGDVQAYVTALHDAAEVFRQAASYGFNCSLLDIGGGYPGDISLDYLNSTTTTINSNEKKQCAMFERIANVIRPILEAEFCDTIIIAEPGRYFTAASHTLVMNVFGERHVKLSEASAQLIKARWLKELQEEEEEEESLLLSHTQQTGMNVNSSLSCVDWSVEHQYYVNDGLYHSFNCILYDHAHPKLYLVYDNTTSDDDNKINDQEKKSTPEVKCDRQLQITTIFGPTCDSLDCILKQSVFPTLYSSSTSSSFSSSTWCCSPPLPSTCKGKVCKNYFSDWLMCTDMGSYTTAAGCAFNGFATRRTEYVCSIDL